MLVTSIFSLSHNVFCSSQHKCQFLSQNILSSANALILDESKCLSFGKELSNPLLLRNHCSDTSTWKNLHWKITFCSGGGGGGGGGGREVGEGGGVVSENIFSKLPLFKNIITQYTILTFYHTTKSKTGINWKQLYKINWQIIGQSKFKPFADNNLNDAKMEISVFDSAQNIILWKRIHLQHLCKPFSQDDGVCSELSVVCLHA